MDIRISPEELRARANTVRGYKNQHDDVIQMLTTLVKNLNQTWQGSAQNAFASKFESMRSTFTNFSNMLEGYAQDMDLAANRMEEVDTDLASRY